MQPRIQHSLAAAVLALSGTVELLLADRKFGLFSGGFGQPRAVDTPAELLAFGSGYALAMVLAGMLAWRIAGRLTGRAGGAWGHLFHFAAGCGGAFLLALALRYQLHAYFSDALSFALIRQLGGGSLSDALLFGRNEIALGLAALAGVLAAYWLGWRWLRRHLPATQPAPAAQRARPVPTGSPLAGLALLVALWVIPARGDDAAFGLNRTLIWSAASRLLDAASDVDRDGYGLFAIARDAAPLDPAAHPMALDVPGNGVDEDGFGGDLRLVPVPAALPPARLPAGTPNLVVVVLESARADALGKVVAGREVTPALNALARTGGATVPAYSHVGFTTASLKSLFTGALQPRPGGPSLFRDLAASGYRIGVFSGQPEDFGDIAATVAMRETADVLVDAETLKDQRAFGFAAQGSLLVDESHLLSAFDHHFGNQRDWQRPVFLYFNFQSAHFPYHHEGMAQPLGGTPLPRGEITAANRDRLAMTYANALAAADAHLARLVERLRQLGVWDNTLLIVTGDHGEELFDSGFLGHGHRLNREQYATFLVANRAGVLPPAPVGLSDYRSILLAALAGKPAPRPDLPPLLHIGTLDEPTAIGLPQPDGSLATLRLDTREACLGQPLRCASLDRMAGRDRTVIGALISRWGSERWAAHSARKAGARR